MDIRIDVIQSTRDILECMSISQIQQASTEDEHLQCLKSFIITDWLSVKDGLHSDLRSYWAYRDDLAVIDGVVMKGRQIIIPTALKQQVLDQLHTNHMGIKKKQSYLLANPYTGLISILILKIYKKTVQHVLSFSRCHPRRK